MQTVQYCTRHDNPIHIGCQIRIPIKDGICIITDTESFDNRYMIATYQGNLKDCSAFTIVGIHNCTPQGLIRAIKEALNK